jgi:hypothetical protein
MLVTWKGATVADYTPAKLLRRFRHFALVWDATGLAADRVATLALYQDGQRVAAYAGALAVEPFEGTLYVGSTNTPVSATTGLQARLPLDNLKLHDTSRSDFTDCANGSDLGQVEASLELAAEGVACPFEGGARPAAGRPLP